MFRKFQSYRFVWIVFIITVLVSCQSLPERRSSTQFVEKNKSGQIVFIGMDNHIYTINPESNKKTSLTDESMGRKSEKVEFRYPTWSWDGTKVAFVSYGKQADGSHETNVYIVNRNGSKLKKIFTSSYHIPFHLYWDPSGNRVSFLSISVQKKGIDLHIVPVNGGESMNLSTGLPFYWSWSPDGQAIVSHTGVSNTQHQTSAQIGLIDARGVNVKVGNIEHEPAYFKAPVYSPDGMQFVVAVKILKGQNILVLISRDGHIQEILADLKGFTAFDWSPAGDRLAYVDGVATSVGGVMGPLTVLDLDSASDPVDLKLDKSNVLAFFWSPDGKRIAYFEPLLVMNEYGGLVLFLDLSILDVETGRILKIGQFLPTTSFLKEVVPLYDQYQRSSTIWSPDSKKIVVNAIAEDNNPGIFIVSAITKETPRFIDYGTLPFWSRQ
jgi:TolB protein